MAATHGEHEDIRRLASVLLIRAGYERCHGTPAIATRCDAEALQLLDMAADDGDELAGTALSEAASVLPSAPFHLLRAMKEGIV